MSTKDKNKVEEFQFQAEMKQLLDLITHSLYTHREIFLRELTSNASDALNKIRFLSLTDKKVLGEDADLLVRIDSDEEKNSLSIADNGIGMSHDELIQNIGTIANSGTLEFAKHLGKDEKKNEEFIGRFGVGFYSVFMVADKVTVETRSYKEEQGFRWISEGTGSYTIEPIEKKERGTTISFTFKEDAKEFATKWRLENIIKKYSDFVAFPIKLNGEDINQSTALWARNKNEVKEEEYTEFYKYLSNSDTEPLSYQHFNVEAPAQFQAILFIPQETTPDWFHSRMETRLHLYVKKVFIQNDCKDLLPSWLRFVTGVVDSQDLPLNVSREVTQNSPVMDKISKYLVRKLLGEFQSWADKDKEKYEKFWKNFGLLLKEGIHMDFANKDKLLELFRCYSSQDPDSLISLKEYVARMQEGQEEIYYVFGKNRQAIERNPNLEYFKKKGIEVLYLYEDIDDFLMPQINEYDGKKIIGADKADLKLQKEDKPEEQEKDQLQPGAGDKLLKYIKDILGDRVSDVVESQRLVESPCTLVTPKEGMNAHMEKMMKMMNQDFQSSKKILEVNLSNPAIKDLSKIQEKFPQDPFLRDCIEELYESSALLEGSLEDPSGFVPRTIGIVERATDLYLKSIST